MPGAAIPVTILTGFLGSGKTTLLNRLLRQPALDGAAVIINEFGEIGLDHLLIESSREQFALLDNGCVCCTVRGDLVATLKDLEQRSAAGDLPPLSHVLIETTGLADPTPILHTLMVEADLAARFRIGGVVTCVDAVNGFSTLERHAEAAKQVALADRLLVTKTDLASEEASRRLGERLSALAPTARRLVVSHGEIAAADLFEGPGLAGAAPSDIARWFEQAALAADAADRHEQGACGPDCGHDHHAHEHHEGHRHHGIQSYSFVIDQPVAWPAFAQWLEYVAALKGEDLLRMKGLVQVADDPERPLVVHGVQHVFHPPQRLDAWPSADRRTRLVFIVRGIPRDVIERTLTKFASIDAARIGRPASALAMA